MSLPRAIYKNTTYLVTRRCTQRQFLLRPSPKINQIILYCLAVASTKYNVLIHVACFLSNHYHLVATDKDGNMPKFLAYLNMYIAKCLNVEHGRFENLFAANEKTSLVTLAEAGDIISKAGYALANPVLAELVCCPEEWPGILLMPSSDGLPEIDVERPKGFFRPNGPMPERATLKLEIPEAFSSDEDFYLSSLTTNVTERVSEKQAEMKRKKRKFMGAKKVLRQNPSSSPRSREPRFQMNPRVAAKNKWARIEALARVKKFLKDYRKAWRAWIGGDEDIAFPKGTYALARLASVKIST
jgi:putative transposase